jgi:hypothetical protein
VLPEAMPPEAMPLEATPLPEAMLLPVVRRGFAR